MTNMASKMRAFELSGIGEGNNEKYTIMQVISGKYEAAKQCNDSIANE